MSNIFFRFQLQSVAKYEKEFCKTSFKCSAHPLLAKSISYFCPSLKTPLASIIIKHTSHQWKLFFVRKCKARQLPFESLPQNVKAYLGKKNLQWSWKSWKWPAIINVCRWKIVQLFRKKLKCMFFIITRLKIVKHLWFSMIFCPKMREAFCKMSFKVF